MPQTSIRRQCPSVGVRQGLNVLDKTPRRATRRDTSRRELKGRLFRALKAGSKKNIATIPLQSTAKGAEFDKCYFLFLMSYSCALNLNGDHNVPEYLVGYAARIRLMHLARKFIL